MVKGADKLRRLLITRFPQAVENRLKEEIEKIANDLVTKMKQRAPVYVGPEIQRSDGSAIRPGALRESINYTFGEAPKGSVTIASAKVGQIRVVIYAGNKEAFYARWVEHGTRQWSGKPFFFISYRDMKRKVKGRLTRAIRKAIKDVDGGKL